MNTHFFTDSSVPLIGNDAIDQCEEGVILSETDIVTGMNPGAYLPNQDGPGCYLLTTVPLDTPVLSVAVSAVSGASARFLVCHDINSLSSCCDAIDFDSGELLTMAIFFVIAFSALGSKNDDLAVFALFENPAVYPNVGQCRLTDPKLVSVMIQKHLIEGNAVSLVSRQLLHPQHLIRLHPILFTAGSHYSVHDPILLEITIEMIKKLCIFI
jgi:hypothetical protein